MTENNFNLKDLGKKTLLPVATFLMLLCGNSLTSSAQHKKSKALKQEFQSNFFPKDPYDQGPILTIGAGPIISTNLPSGKPFTENIEAEFKLPLPVFNTYPLTVTAGLIHDSSPEEYGFTQNKDNQSFTYQYKRSSLDNAFYTRFKLRGGKYFSDNFAIDLYLVAGVSYLYQLSARPVDQNAPDLSLQKFVPQTGVGFDAHYFPYGTKKRISPFVKFNTEVMGFLCENKYDSVNKSSAYPGPFAQRMGLSLGVAF